MDEPPKRESMQYFNASYRMQQQIIIPDMRFTCHGVITAWSALTIVLQRNNWVDILKHKITFMVWRPRKTNNFDLVGQNEYLFTGAELKNGISEVENSTGFDADLGYFQFNRTKSEEQIAFQPGDVVGWKVHAYRYDTDVPLSVLFKRANSQDTANVVDLLVLERNNSIVTYCSILECDVVQTVSSVIPFISVEYGKWSLMNLLSM